MTDTTQDRLRDGADRFLKWAHKEQYSGPSVLSIPRHPANIDALLETAATHIDAQDAKIKALVEAGERDERAHGNTIDQRDAMESAFARAYELVMGRPIEWSSAYHTDEALHDMEAALAAAKETT